MAFMMPQYECIMKFFIPLAFSSLSFSYFPHREQAFASLFVDSSFLFPHSSVVIMRPLLLRQQFQSMCVWRESMNAYKLRCWRRQEREFWIWKSSFIDGCEWNRFSRIIGANMTFEAWGILRPDGLWFKVVIPPHKTTLLPLKSRSQAECRRTRKKRVFGRQQPVEMEEAEQETTQNLAFTYRSIS